MTRRAQGTAIAVAVVIAALLAVLGSSSHDPVGAMATGRGLADPEAVADVEGPSARIYAVDYESRDRVTLAEGTAFEGAMRIDADLRVAAAGTIDGHEVVALSFERVREASLEVAGGELASAPGDARLFVELGEDGAPIAFHGDAAEPSSGTHLLRALALDLGVALTAHPRGEGWSSRETTPRGDARSRYAATREGFSRL
ncbi:MAG: hypothetical protein KC619_14000, partial [Myxococcales bacterium]|nr:hypothetical protein [Myxococcales bacterium]